MVGSNGNGEDKEGSLIRLEREEKGVPIGWVGEPGKRGRIKTRERADRIGRGETESGSRSVGKRLGPTAQRGGGRSQANKEKGWKMHANWLNNLIVLNCVAELFSEMYKPKPVEEPNPVRPSFFRIPAVPNGECTPPSFPNGIFTGKLRDRKNQSSRTWLKKSAEKKVTKPTWPDFVSISLKHPFVLRLFVWFSQLELGYAYITDLFVLNLLLCVTIRHESVG
ncbi:hypothetical protein RHGRI_014304 [Rhododendron griersonianum]|uniref:Uncharacterized protein n=1 Tax=Rhododendron griersonianum TaxID=479676 RepID=A0AAV6K9B8_9ERIC|nr:hypothetical protein RHGRI_014304 [Rhododendron griersonianum]